MSYVFGLFFQVKLFTFDILLTSWSRDFHRALMVRYFDLNLCDKSTCPVITISRNMLCPLSTFLSIMIEQVQGDERKESVQILGGQSYVFIVFLSYFFCSLHVKHHLQWHTLQQHSVSVEGFFLESLLQTLLMHNLLIFIKGEACSFALPPAFIRQRVIVVCPITVLK